MFARSRIEAATQTATANTSGRGKRAHVITTVKRWCGGPCPHHCHQIRARTKQRFLHAYLWRGPRGELYTLSAISTNAEASVSELRCIHAVSLAGPRRFLCRTGVSSSLLQSLWNALLMGPTRADRSTQQYRMRGALMEMLEECLCPRRLASRPESLATAVFACAHQLAPSYRNSGNEAN